ncbi:MAG: TylF/MycF/NovP-related O-methyltransferase [Candidatus Binataceae bacterium]
MKALSSLKAMIWRNYFIPFLGRRNWRPAGMIPLRSDYLQATFGFEEEAIVKEAARIVLNNTMVSFERLATLWQQVRYLDRYEISGSLVECGVWKGGCVGLMALAHLHSHKKPFREIHLFDSFQGLPQPDRKVDGIDAIELANGKADGACVPIGNCVAAAEESRELLIHKIGYPSELIKFHVGWFQDTLPKGGVLMGPIGLLRLDGDWYYSTKLCLTCLYGKVSPFGIVITDDYGHFAGCRKAIDEFIGGLDRPVFLNHIDYTGRFWIKN